MLETVREYKDQQIVSKASSSRNLVRMVLQIRHFFRRSFAYILLNMLFVVLMLLFLSRVVLFHVFLA